MATDLPPADDSTPEQAQPFPDYQSEQPASAPASVEGRAARPTNTGRAWVSVAVAALLLVLLIIFIAENSDKVKISFLGASGDTSVALALLASAVAGVLITLLIGSGRILQLRREVRRRGAGHRRAQSSAEHRREG
jgi:uncharacterized integral membrane protein